MTGPQEKLLGALGFAMKAGRLQVGEFAADRAVKAGKAALILVDASASDNTKKQWQDAAAYRKLPLLTVKGLGEAIGKPGRMAAAVTDGNFANMITKACKSLNDTDFGSPAEESGHAAKENPDESGEKEENGGDC